MPPCNIFFSTDQTRLSFFIGGHFVTIFVYFFKIQRRLYARTAMDFFCLGYFL